MEREKRRDRGREKLSIWARPSRTWNFIWVSQVSGVDLTTWVIFFCPEAEQPKLELALI